MTSQETFKSDKVFDIAFTCSVSSSRTPQHDTPDDVSQLDVIRLLETWFSRFVVVVNPSIETVGKLAFALKQANT